MKKVLILAVVGILLFGNVCYAQLTQNASPVTVELTGATTYKNITFNYPTRSIIIKNEDADSYVFVDLLSASNTSDTAKCSPLKYGEEIALYDFITIGISILKDTTGRYGSTNAASPIIVIPTY